MSGIPVSYRLSICRQAKYRQVLCCERTGRPEKSQNDIQRVLFHHRRSQNVAQGASKGGHERPEDYYGTYAIYVCAQVYFCCSCNTHELS